LVEKFGGPCAVVKVMPQSMSYRADGVWSLRVRTPQGIKFARLKPSDRVAEKAAHEPAKPIVSAIQPASPATPFVAPALSVGSMSRAAARVNGHNAENLTERALYARFAEKSDTELEALVKPALAARPLPTTGGWVACVLHLRSILPALVRATVESEGGHSGAIPPSVSEFIAQARFAEAYHASADIRREFVSADSYSAWMRSQPAVRAALNHQDFEARLKWVEANVDQVTVNSFRRRVPENNTPEKATAYLQNNAVQVGPNQWRKVQQ
jgi:hypothetical protein